MTGGIDADVCRRGQRTEHRHHIAFRRRRTDSIGRSCRGSRRQHSETRVAIDHQNRGIVWLAVGACHRDERASGGDGASGRDDERIADAHRNGRGFQLSGELRAGGRVWVLESGRGAVDRRRRGDGLGRTVVEGRRASSDVATRVSGLAVITDPDALLAVLVTTVGEAMLPGPADGSMAHNTASDSRPPIAPVVISRPRPIASGGSVCAHVARPSSDGWRHARS